MVENKTKGGGNRSEFDYPMETTRGVTMFLSNYHYFNVMAYDKGDMDAVAMLVDFEEAMKNVELTDRQREAIFLVYEIGMNQREAGESLGITKQAVQRLVGAVASKIAEYYRMKSEGIIGGKRNERNSEKKT